MPRSSRHKSSRHRDYSDSDKESGGGKERRGKEENSGSARVSKEKESGYSEKRKIDSKDNDGYGEQVEEYSSGSKRRRDRNEDRWNGGGDDDRGDGTRKSKERGYEPKSSKRDESESEDWKGKQHRESGSRKEGREGGSERDRGRDREREREKEKDKERKSKEGKSDKFLEADGSRVSKQVVSEKSEFDAHDLIWSPELDMQSDRRTRRKRNGLEDGDKNQDETDSNSKRSSSKDVAKDGRPKDDKHRDERYRDKYQEDVEREDRRWDDKQSDECSTKGHNRSHDKHLKDEKDTGDTQQMKSKREDGDHDHDRDRENPHYRDSNLVQDRDQDFDQESHRDRVHDRDRNRGRERDRDRDRDRERDYDHDSDWDRDREREYEHDRDRNRERDRDRPRDRERARERDRDRNLDYDGSNMDDRSARYKDRRGRKRSPNDRDGYTDAKSRRIRSPYPDAERKSMSGSRVESDVDDGWSLSRQVHRQRNLKPDELKLGDSVVEQSPIVSSPREVAGINGGSEKVSVHLSTEKPSKMDDEQMGDMSHEKGFSVGSVDRSPSSSADRRFINKPAVRRSLDVDESGRRRIGSIGSRDFPSEERSYRDMDKLPVDELASAYSSFYNRSGQGNPSLIPPPAFRGGVGSPFSVEEDSLANTSGRYKRPGDPNMSRWQGNAWKGAPNWSSSVPNGYFPHQHGPPLGPFQARMPQFPSPPMFGVRPPMEVNHSGISYHITDSDKFSGHMHLLGWQNMVDGTGPSHMHGWSANEGVFRDEMQMYRGSDWDQNRHPVDGLAWKSGADMWKVQNGDLTKDMSSASIKEDLSAHTPGNDPLAGQRGRRSQNEDNCHELHEKSFATKLIVASAANGAPESTDEMTLNPSKTLNDDNAAHFFHAYLSKLDISAELIGPELNRQCMRLLGGERNGIIFEEAVMVVNLKAGARAVPKSSKSLLSPSLFTTTREAIFQKAFNIYKKQKVSTGMRVFNAGVVDVSATKVGEHVLGNGMDEVEEPIVSSAEKVPDIILANLDQENAKTESVSNAPEDSEDVVLTSDQVVPVDTHTSPLKLNSLDQAVIDGHLGSPVAVPCSDETIRMLPELVESELAQDMHDIAPAPVVNLAATKVDEAEDEAGEVQERKSHVSDGEGKGFEDGENDALFMSDGISKQSEALTLESNESESVMLSRIHHSPESTL